MSTYTSTLALHRAAVVAKLRSVDSVGVVHPEEPFARQEAAFRALYGWDDGYGTKQLRGWFVRRTNTAERELGLGRVMNTFTWAVRGFMALDSDRESGQVFDELIEAIRKSFRLDPQLSGTVDPGPLGDRTGVQVTDAGPVMFAGVLCHSASLSLQTFAYLNDGE